MLWHSYSPTLQKHSKGGGNLHSVCVIQTYHEWNTLWAPGTERNQSSPRKGSDSHVSEKRYCCFHWLAFITKPSMKDCCNNVFPEWRQGRPFPIYSSGNLKCLFFYSNSSSCKTLASNSTLSFPPCFNGL